MNSSDIANTLTKLFGTSVNAVAPGSWQVETPDFRLLILLSDDGSWLRALLPIMPIQEAQPFFEQLLEANFDNTHACRYALHQNVLWGVFHHFTNSLTTQDFEDAILKLVSMRENGLNDIFSNLVESRIQLIVQAAKQQGQTLEATMQNLDRFYAEGLMGEIDESPETRQKTLAAWRRQLERLWNEAA
jgi:hypothetical protein